jgi:hypothetical protein
MGDHSTETLQFQILDVLSDGQYLDLDEGTIPLILNHIDCFVSECRGNENIIVVELDPHAFYGRDDEVWDKVGQAVGELQALERLSISNPMVYDDDGDDQVVPIPDWEILASILRHIRQKVTVDISEYHGWATEEVQPFARVIRGHSAISGFDSCYNFPYESMDMLYSALATLPALEWIRLYSPAEDEITFANPESLTELLRVPSLRSVWFRKFDFTSALCQATANALVEGTAITYLEFRNCTFSAERSAAVLANGLSKNTSVSFINVVSPLDQALYSALATALPLNSTLRRLDLEWGYINDDHDLSPVLLALRKNMGLKELSLDGFGSIDESLCTAIKDGLGMKTTLESLVFTCFHR